MAKYLDSIQFARVWAKIQTLLKAKADLATTLAGYGIKDAYTKAEIDAMLQAAVHYAGSVEKYSDLPTNAKLGDMYNVTEDGHNYCWDGKAWDDLGGLIDLSAYFTKEEVNTLLAKKVDKEDGKGLSTEDFTTAFKTKLTGVEEGAQVNVLEGIQIDGVDVTLTGKKANLALAAKFEAKVDKVEGKGLSTNDYDNTEKAAVAANTSARHTHSNKTVLDGITADKVSAWDAAEANVIETIKVDGTALTPSAKAVNIDLATPLATKVDKVDGKQLSDENFTAELKAKLQGVEAGAQVNVIESIVINGTEATVDAKKASITIDIPEVEAMTEAEIDAIINT